MTGELALVRQLSFPDVASATDAAQAMTERHVTEAFACYRMPVSRYVQAILRDPDGADDITQETFLRYMQELLQGHTVHNTKAWLFRTAHNMALNRCRDGEKFVQMEESGLSFDQTPSVGGQFPLAEEHSSMDLRAALQQLSPREQRCIELRVEGLLYREIAEVLGIRISSVSIYVERAIRKLSQAVNA